MNWLSKVLGATVCAFALSFSVPTWAQFDPFFLGTQPIEEPEPEPMLPLDPCWNQLSRAFHLWTCAGSSLPAGVGQEFAYTPGVIDGERAVLIIDPGVSVQVGKQLGKDTLKRFPGRKIFVVNTQPKAEFFMGNQGVQDAVLAGEGSRFSFKGRIVSGRTTANEIRRTCPRCVLKLARRMGVVTPLLGQLLPPDFFLDRKEGSFRILDPEWATWEYKLTPSTHVAEAMVVHNVQEGVYWVGDFVQETLVPELGETNIAGRLNYLARVQTLMQAQDHLVSQKGKLDNQWLGRNLRYFRDLQLKVLVALETGVSEVQLVRQVVAEQLRAAPSISREALKAHAANASSAYQQLEVDFP